MLGTLGTRVGAAVGLTLTLGIDDGATVGPMLIVGAALSSADGVIVGTLRTLGMLGTLG